MQPTHIAKALNSKKIYLKHELSILDLKEADSKKHNKKPTENHFSYLTCVAGVNCFLR